MISTQFETSHLLMTLFALFLLRLLPRLPLDVSLLTVVILILRHSGHF